MGDRKKTNFNRRGFILSAILLLSSVFIFTGCLSYPGGYRGPVEPDSSGGMNRSKHYQGSIFYLDQTSLYRSGNFAIRNARGQVVYMVRGNLFSRGRRVSVSTPNGRLLYYITSSGTGYSNRYRVYDNRRRWAAKIYKKRTRNYEQYYVNSRNGKDYKVRGNFMGRLYAFFYRNRQVAQIQKRRRGLSDNYVIEIEPYQNTLVILLTSIIIDLDNMNNMYQRR
ncbi:MAG: LURP-one-related family protein [Acidobacteriota bacterium]